MMLDTSALFSAPLNGFGRSPSEQALENLAQALRALELAPPTDSELCPHPLVIVRAEIENARRYLLAQAKAGATSPHTARTPANDHRSNAARPLGQRPRERAHTG